MFRQPTPYASDSSPAGRRAALFLGLLVAGLAAAPPAAGQNACEIVLREAERSYQAGRIEEVFAVREVCLRGKVTRQQRVQAYALLAKVHVALDQLAKARKNVENLLTYDADYQADERRDPVQFVRLVEELKGAGAVVTVASVSKTDEPLREAPATAMVVTREEIARRGYLDLEQVLHDLPGFDISRGMGTAYSNIYQRGFRSETTDRTLFLLDGVEQNDLWSNTAYLSRQYPVSNVEQIEVVYGPASTMYGANAFTGVINVITRQPDRFLEGNQRVGAEAELVSGSWDTRALEVNVAGRITGRASYSLSSRIYRSDEPDLTSFDEWDFLAKGFDSVDYKKILSVSGKNQIDQYLAEVYLRESNDTKVFFLPDKHPFYNVTRNDQGVAVAIDVTDEGADAARALDKAAYLSLVETGEAGFSNPTDDWLIDAKLQLPNLTFGLQTWRREEGSTAWFSDLNREGNGSLWIPRSTSIYLKYLRSIGTNTSIQLFSRFKKHDLDNETGVRTFRSYAGGTWDLKQLVPNLVASDFTFPLQSQESDWFQRYFHQSSTQLRNELTVFYSPHRDLNIISGIEYRESSIQVDLVATNTPDAADTGEVIDPGSLSGSTHLDQTDIGVFSQLSYKPRRDLKVVAGGRIDSNEIRETAGYGTVFNPRLALIYAPERGSYVLKAVYAEAFKDPSNNEKFGFRPDVIEERNPDLEPEKVANFELCANWQINDHVFADVSGYESTYDQIVDLVEVPKNCFACTTTTIGQFQNRGQLRIRGIQANVQYSTEDFTFAGNYTYTDPLNVNLEGSEGNVRVGDIAEHRANLVFNTAFWREKINLNLRANYVGERRTGAGTTVGSNPLDAIDAYSVVHAGLTYRGVLPEGSRWGTSSLQLVVNNVFDETYFHPGVAQAGIRFAAALPQPGRSIFLRLRYSY